MRLNEDEFLELLHREEGRLMRVAWAILGNEADAWDALQDAALRAWTRRHSLRGGKSAFPGWIRQIVVTSCIDLLRKRSRETPTDPDRTASQADHHVPAHDPVESSVDMAAALRALPAEQRCVVALRFLGDLALNEIADRLGIPVGTVKSRLHRGLETLEGLLSEPQSGGGAAHERRSR